MVKHLVGEVTDLAVGSLTRLTLQGQEVCLVRVDETSFFAVDDNCTHEDFSLSEGELWGMEIECPGHFSLFDLVTGEPSGPPATIALQTYSVHVENDRVYVEIQERA